ncbi:MAG: hypothetical protein LBI39_00215 [Puniceicoccales bacterium]|jgi:hypothetical protein|nr:hypothetical protein [Puniceicoccales bacterium]
MALIDDAMQKSKDGHPQTRGTLSILVRHPMRAVAIAMVAAAATLWIGWTIARVKSEHPNADAEENAIQSQICQNPNEFVSSFSIGGVRVGTYETVALIGGKTVHQGQWIGKGGESVQFVGVSGKDLLFKGKSGELYSRNFMPNNCN